MPPLRTISRRLGKLVGSGDTMLCAHCYARDWWLAVRVLDAFAVLAWGEGGGHCRRCWREEIEVPEPAERARRAGL